MDITLDFKSKRVQGTVTLPASKSISNRVLIVNALADSELPIENLADCDDTQSMVRILCSENSYFDVGHAGTAMRFLTAYLSRFIGKWVLTGSERMKQRPIRVLVEALNRLGARIGYLENEGFPPLEIYGSRLVGGSIDIPASVSSQYISALLRIGNPAYRQGSFEFLYRYDFADHAGVWSRSRSGGYCDRSETGRIPVCSLPGRIGLECCFLFL